MTKSKESWWDDRVLEHDSKALFNKIIAKKTAKGFTGVTRKDLESGQFRHIIVYKL